MDDKDKALANGFVVGIVFVVAIYLALTLLFGRPGNNVYREMCPALLAHAPTLNDSLNVIHDHNGCWTYVHPEAP